MRKSFGMFINHGFIILFLVMGSVVSAQAPSADYLPSFSISSGIIQYNISSKDVDNGESKPLINFCFSSSGSKIAVENFLLVGVAPKEIYKNGYAYKVGLPEGCATKHELKESTFNFSSNAGFIKKFNDLINNRINKKNTKSFAGFSKTGEVIFLGLNCDTYEYKEYNSGFSSIDKYLFIAYRDICLSQKFYFGNGLISTIEATGFEQNISVPDSVFEIPKNIRIIDGDKLNVLNAKSSSEIPNLIIEYYITSDYGQIKKDGKKTLFVKDIGKVSAEDCEWTESQFDLPAEKKHEKIIREDNYEYSIDYIEKTVRSRRLITSEFDCIDKPIAVRKYILENNLYDNSVRFIGDAEFLGKNCKIYEIRSGIEKLEVYVWNGVFLKTKRFICTERKDCTQFVLISEEAATYIQENISVNASEFQYPDSFKVVVE